jgi:RIO-like serine/threonine protein kinase
MEKTPRPIYSLRALGKRDLPPQIEIGGKRYIHLKTHKHDFWAVTGFYEDEHDERVVLKMGRVDPFAGLPLKWIGRWLCRREVRFYKALSDLGNVPEFLGFFEETGFVHRYTPGRPLEKGKPVPDGYFAQLQDLMREIHRRNIAYVDANKPENILLGDDGRPHLIDFQISWDLHELGNWWLNRLWLRRLQHEDLYHILKHKRRMRPDEMTPEEQQAAQKRSLFIRIHRFVTKPYFVIRRALFKKLRESGRILPEGSK